MDRSTGGSAEGETGLSHGAGSPRQSAYPNTRAPSRCSASAATKVRSAKLGATWPTTSLSVSEGSIDEAILLGLCARDRNPSSNLFSAHRDKHRMSTVILGRRRLLTYGSRVSDGYPVSSTCLSVSRLAATDALTLEAARGARSRNTPEDGLRFTTGQACPVTRRREQVAD